ncbi:PHP domain-containing protein [Desulfolithobacter dissulfuricans]|uniref:PHP domain-containing protein n=1 Tax=Desulfolithobacter dissulfuricans TaxID=2795293 RepID=A0A915XL29_9BACT|nr:histidinol phosphate phosphatase domain-containing protein [Desulfolithobacter dissulfuricans]BCO09086.1 PHP domain-containing protein [Desulfolithobacter dissulfuricans]
MIDLHTHTFFSDGALVPAEHLRRVEVLGYEAVAITDHADSSNLDFIIPRIVKAAQDLSPLSSTRLIPGIELTHVPPELIGPLTARARELGARIVVVHGETPVEPVKPGTNRAALEAGVELLAHPGFISEEDAALAAEKGIFLELSGRKGHSLTNGHVARMAEKTGALLAVNADAHEPGDFLTSEMARKVALGAGLSEERYKKLRRDMAELVDCLK